MAQNAGVVGGNSGHGGQNDQPQQSFVPQTFPQQLQPNSQTAQSALNNTQNPFNPLQPQGDFSPQHLFPSQFK